MSFDYTGHEEKMRRNHGKMVGAIQFYRDNPDGVYAESAIGSLLEALEEYEDLHRMFMKSLEEKENESA